MHIISSQDIVILHFVSSPHTFRPGSIQRTVPVDIVSETTLRPTSLPTTALAPHDAYDVTNV